MNRGGHQKKITELSNLDQVVQKFQDMMRMMRRRDPQTAEDGFGLLQARAAEHVEELIAEFRAERDDHGLRCWLLELIGDARSPLAVPLLTELVHSQDESFRDWAVRGLTQLGSKQARQVLWRARANGQTGQRYVDSV